MTTAANTATSRRARVMKMTTLSSFWRLSGVSVILPSGTFCLASASEVLVQKHVLYTTADTHVGGGFPWILRILTTSYKPCEFKETMSFCRALSRRLLSISLIQYTMGLG
jgi:hypothetical protein